MTTPFRRTAIASAVSGIALALSAGQAFGSAFALAEQNCAGARQRLCRRRRPPPRTRTPCGSTPRVSRGSICRRPSRAPCDHPVGQVPECELAGGGPATAGRHGRRRRQRCVRAEPVRIDGPHRQGPHRDRRQRALRPQDRIRRRLARPLSGAQVRSQDDQRQPGGVLQGDRPVLDRRRRELSAFRGDAHQQRELLGGAGARLRSGRRGRPDHSGAGGGVERGDGGSRYVREGHRRRRRVGMERRRDVQLQRRRQQRPRGGKNRPRLSVEAQVQRRRQRQLHESDAADADRPRWRRSIPSWASSAARSIRRGSSTAA